MNKLQKVKRVDTQKPYAKLIFHSSATAPLETYIKELLYKCKKSGYKTKGPISLPNKDYIVNVRKSPGGRGSGTRVEYKRISKKKVLGIYDHKLFMYIMTLLKDVPADIQIRFEMC